MNECNEIVNIVSRAVSKKKTSGKGDFAMNMFTTGSGLASHKIFLGKLLQVNKFYRG